MRIFFSPHKMGSDDDDDDVDSEEFVWPNPLVLYVVLLASDFVSPMHLYSHGEEYVS